MPVAPLRPCLSPRCRGRVRSGYCRDCARGREQQRGSAHARGYTRRWERYRKAWLAEHPICGDRASTRSTAHSRCWKERRVVAARHVDHITPHEGDQELFWDSANHQSLCASCHSRKTIAELRGALRASRNRDGGGHGVESVRPTSLRTASAVVTRVDEQKRPISGTRRQAGRKAHATRRTS